MEIAPEWPYQTEDSMLIPYCKQWGFPEEFLVRIYFQAKKENLLETVFPASGLMDLDKFMGCLHDKPLVVGLTKPTYTVAGIGWLYAVEGQEGWRKAFVGFLFFRDSWATYAIRSIARQALRWWFCELKVDVLFGTTLPSNAVARNFSKKLGFTEIALIPKFIAGDGKLHDTSLVMCAKEDFLVREALSHARDHTNHHRSEREYSRT